MKPMNKLRIMPGLACLLIVIAAASCQTTTPPAADATKTLTPSHWVKVSSQPPTYYPRGVSADHSTDHWSGEWVYADDAKGSRYFIPIHGLGTVNRQSLIQEALSARSEKKLAKIAAEDREIRNKGLRKSFILIPANLLLAMGGGFGGFDEAMLDDVATGAKTHWKEQLASDDSSEARLAAK
jgi:hypothetical protein